MDEKAGPEITLSEKILNQIIDRQEKFFKIGKSATKTSEQEMTRHAQDIVAAYESYLSDNPKDVHALILFGKFLRKVGQQEHAVDFFIQADKINPKLAVVKQQLANYLIEKGKPVDAFPYFILTIELNPNEAVYHFHLGNFLFLFQKELINEGILNRLSAQSFMHRSFLEATILKPNNFDFQLRYAQSFFDFPESNKAKALIAWEKIEKNFPDRSKLEHDYFRLCRARVLLELNRQKDASLLINSVSSKSLQEVRDALLLQANDNKLAPVPIHKPDTQEKNNKQSYHQFNHKNFLPTDPHLERLRKLTSRLIEEKMLSDLKVDAIKANYNKSGEIKIQITKAR
jgi:tetratricopeptide (TPR) repeat protein